MGKPPGTESSKNQFVSPQYSLSPSPETSLATAYDRNVALTNTLQTSATCAMRPQLSGYAVGSDAAPI